MGGLLAVAAVLFAVATAFVATGGFGGTPIPIGVVLVGLLAWVLLRAELTDDGDEVETHGNSDVSTDEAINEPVDDSVDEPVDRF